MRHAHRLLLPPTLALCASACVGDAPESPGARPTAARVTAPPVERAVDADLEALEGWKATIRGRFPDVRHVDATALAAELAAAESGAGEAPLLLDVRAPEEAAVSRLPGAVRAETLEEALAVLGDVEPGRRIVAYCSIGYRSSELVEQLNARGFTNAVNLEGSIFEWGNQGRAVVGPDGEPVKGIHPYDSTWGRLLDSPRWDFGSGE